MIKKLILLILVISLCATISSTAMCSIYNNNITEIVDDYSVYFIYLKDFDYVVDVTDIKPNSYAILRYVEDDTEIGSSSQVWEFRKLKNGCYVINNEGSYNGKVYNTCLAVNNDNRVYLQSKKSSKYLKNEQWKFVRYGNYYKIINNFNGKYLNIKKYPDHYYLYTSDSSNKWILSVS